MTRRFRQPDVAIVGGGPIGLAIAWRLLRAGRSVTVIDSAEPNAAWRVAAGMLSPTIEADYGKQQLSELAADALRGYAEFVARLESEASLATGYQRAGSLSVALDRDQLEALRRRFSLLRDELGLEVAWLLSAACREREPLLASGVAGGIFAHGDAQVDPRALVAALHDVVRRRGGVLRKARAERLILEAGRVVGVETEDEPLRAGTVVLAAGAWAEMVGAPVRPPVRPVKGQILRLRADRSPHVLLQSDEVYVLRRASGEVVLGATVEEQGFNRDASAGGTLHLLDGAVHLLPGVREWPLVEVGVGFRPATPDNAPLIGELAPGLVVACGHYRSGILLASVTAEAVAQLIDDGELPTLVAPFAPGRVSGRV
jgi:glycine oxidase